MIARAFVIAVASVLAACGGPSKPTASSVSAPEKVLVLVDPDGVALGGHDPMSYRAGTPAIGTAEHTAPYGGATYRFASPGARDKFAADPASLVPRYGGYCAFAASQNRLSEADPTVFEIVDGQLLVFTNADFKAQFDRDVAANHRLADANWPGLVAKHGKPAPPR